MAIVADSNFIEAVRAREKSALSLLVREYTGQLYRAALGMRLDRDAASEVVQEVWATLVDVAPRFEGKSHIRTFIFGILYNKVSELRRDRRRFEQDDPVEEILERRFDRLGKWVKPVADPESFLIASENLKSVGECLEGLPASQQMAFWLKEVEQYPGKEICKILDVKVSNLGVLLFRARNRLRECLEGKAVTLGGKRL